MKKHVYNGLRQELRQCLRKNKMSKYTSERFWDNLISWMTAEKLKKHYWVTDLLLIQYEQILNNILTKWTDKELSDFIDAISKKHPKIY